MPGLVAQGQHYYTSFYIKARITYKRPRLSPVTYEFFLLCDRHEMLQHHDPRIEAFLKFNNICFMCPLCPQYISEHHHYETETCTPRCMPLRVAFSPFLPVDEESYFHKCQYHHYPSLRNPYCPHFIPQIPPHNATPHFRTYTEWDSAIRRIFRAVQPLPQPEERILLGLPGAHGRPDLEPEEPIIDDDEGGDLSTGSSPTVDEAGGPAFGTCTVS